MVSAPGFEELIAEGEAVPLEGWDFSWFAGRATEERTPWRYASRISDRFATSSAVLDIQTGGGEVYAWALARVSTLPTVLAATEAWEPNVAVARQTLACFGVEVVQVAEDAPLPFHSRSFELVVSRHPVETNWQDVARILRKGGVFLSQQVGAGSNRALIDFLMGPQPISPARGSSAAVRAAEEAGLVVTDLREARLRVEFFDVGAVVHFLRKVLWTVPDFSVDRYRDRLWRLHQQIVREGSFVCHSTRFLIEARRPLEAGKRE